MADAGTGRTGAALLVGIGSYLHAERVSPLRYAARDAKALADVLVDPGVCGFAGERVALLTDAGARRDDIVHRLSNWLLEKAQGADIVVVYFAGHGTVHRIGPREEGFLLSYDADPEDLVTRGVAMSDVARWIEGIQASAVVVCLDCCHAGKVVAHRGPAQEPDQRERDMRLRPAVLQGLSGRGRFLIASCDEGQTSVEAEPLGHGLFTYHLLRGLRGEGDRDGDGRVGVAELFEYVARAVEEDARIFGTEQRPWYSAVGPGGVYISAPAPRPRPDPSLLSPALAAERVWREEGPAAAVREIERALPVAGVDSLLGLLDLLGRMNDPAGVPSVFRCLTNASEAVRQRARRVLHAFGWERAVSAVEDLARRADGERVGAVLDGLAAFESHREVVALLDRLVARLRGDLRNRAILLLERKRLGLEVETMAEVFREIRSPYQIQKALGQGLFTSALLARNEENDLDVVVRVLRPEFAGQPHLRAWFLDLSRKSVRYVHHNLVLTRESRDFPDRNLYYAVRDYVNGVTLQKLLESGRRFSPAQVLKVLRQLLDALTPLHKESTPHGGIKPSNIFLCGEDRVVLGDVSLAAQGAGGAHDRLSYDYRYAPPELFRGGGVLGPGSDFYALGCVAYELACGAPPFVSDNPFELATRHDREVVEPPGRRGSRLGEAGDRLILQLLAKSAADRFRDIEEALEAIDALRETWRRPPQPGQPSVSFLAQGDLARYEANQSIVTFGVRPARDAGDQESARWGGITGPGPLGTGGGPPSVPSPSPGDPTRSEAAQPIVAVDARPAKVAEDQPSDRSSALAGSLGGSDAVWMTLVPKPGTDTTEGLDVPGYEILTRLGQGGMGVVFKARHRKLDRLVALKMIRAGILAGPEELARFRIEAEAVARLSHANIMQIHDIGEVAGFPYFSLELLEGGSLSDRLAGSPQPSREAAVLLATLARAIHAAHQAGIVHRDLKPANVLFDAEGTPKVIDFSLAKRLEQEDGHTQTGQVMGTPSYMAPELARGETREIGPAVDVYGLGAILYEMLTGRPPFRGKSSIETIKLVVEQEPVPPSRLLPKVPRDLETICLKCLNKEPRKRYLTAAQLAEDLERYLAVEPIQARPTSSLERGWKWARRRPAVALLALSVSALGVLVGAGFRYESLRRVDERRLLQMRSQANNELLKAQDARARRDWDEGKLIMSKLLTRLENEPRLADLRDQAVSVMERIGREQKDQEEQIRREQEDREKRKEERDRPGR
jgi:serine/threonine protein kinase